MADSVLGLGPNLNAYRAALQQRSPQGSTQTQQMVHMARDVARTLNAAFSNVPLPVTTTPTKRERDILKLREAIEQMVLALSTAVKDGGFDGVAWSEDGGGHLLLPADKTPVERQPDRLELSVRSRQMLTNDPETLEALERSLHPLDDAEAARGVAWLAQAQVLHQAILALNAQANIDPTLAKRVLELSDGDSIKRALSRRAHDLANLVKDDTSPDIDPPIQEDRD